jgi:hypothetical protein
LGGIGSIKFQTRNDLVVEVTEAWGSGKIERDKELEGSAACSSIGKSQLRIGPTISPNVYFRVNQCNKQLLG